MELATSTGLDSVIDWIETGAPPPTATSPIITRRVRSRCGTSFSLLCVMRFTLWPSSNRLTAAHRIYPPAVAAASDFSVTRSVSSMSASLCAVEMKPASNGDGAKNTPPSRHPL